MRSATSAIAICVAFALAGCGGSGVSSTGSTESTPTATTESATTATTESAAATAKAEAMTKPKVVVPKGPPPKKLVIKDLKVGSGPEVKAREEVRDKVFVEYVGVNYRNGKEFDSSWERGKPFAFTVNFHEVIPGWDKGMVGMKEGGRRELIIPPNLAYGKAGIPPSIPPNETLVFVIDLLEVVR